MGGLLHLGSHADRLRCVPPTSFNLKEDSLSCLNKTAFTFKDFGPEYPILCKQLTWLVSFLWTLDQRLCSFPVTPRTWTFVFWERQLKYVSQSHFSWNFAASRQTPSSTSELWSTQQGKQTIVFPNVRLLVKLRTSTLTQSEVRLIHYCVEQEHPFSKRSLEVLVSFICSNILSTLLMLMWPHGWIPLKLLIYIGIQNLSGALFLN